MKPIAIVYTSNTGFTAEYASLLGGETGMPVYSMEEAEKRLPPHSPILYMGWLAAGKVQGYDKAVTKFNPQALCAVGMTRSGSQMEDVKKSNDLPEGLPLFTLQGGFDLKKLRGVYKLMMSVMSKMVAKKLAAKSERTPDEEDTLDLFRNGGSRVSLENLKPVLEWYQGVSA